MGIIKNWRIKQACKFGRIEHTSGRWMGIFALLSIALYLTPKYDLSIPLLISLILTAVSWLIYLISHKIEKKLYPNNFRGWK